MNRLDAGGMRLQFLQTIAVDHLTGDAVLLAAFVDGIQAREFAVVDGHDHLAAHIERQLLFGAEGLHCLQAFAAVNGAKRSRSVVDPRVQHTGVAAGLVGRPAGLPFPERAHGDRETGV